MKHVTRLFATALALALLPGLAPGQTSDLGIGLVKDINTSAGGGSSPDQAVNVSGLVYFSAYDPANGDREPWITDGTTAGTQRIADIHPTGSSQPRDFIYYGGSVYFSAEDGSNGREVWRTDGTAGGTEMVMDINPGASGSSPNAFVIAGGRLYFTANDGTNGREWWTTDGSTTQMVDNLDGGSGWSVTDEPYKTVYDGSLFFASQNLANGEELWEIDGLTAIEHDLEPGSDGSGPAYLATVGDGIVFAAATTAEGAELFHFDGVADSVLTQADYDRGPYNIQVLGSGTILYVAEEPFSSSGEELYAYDTGEADNSRLVKDINSGSSNSDMENFFLDGDRLFFSADDGTGAELWVTDGTTGGTEKVQEINPYGFPSPRPLGMIGDRLVFKADNDTLGTEFWVTDAAATSAAMIADLMPGWENGAYGEWGEPVAGGLLVSGGPDSTGTELYKIEPGLPPTPFALLAPADGDTLTGESGWATEHRWEQSEDPNNGQTLDGYTLWLTATLPDGDTTLTVSGIADTSRLLNLPDSLGLAGFFDPVPVSWHAAAVSAGDTTFSDTAAYTLAPLPELVLLAPGEGDTVATADTSLAWDYGGSATYTVLLDTAADLGTAQTVASGLADTTVPTPTLEDDTRYYWAVMASDASYGNVWSDTSHFQVAVPEAPGPFVMLSPEEGTTVPTDSVLATWTSSSDPDPGDVLDYRVEWTAGTFGEGNAVYAASVAAPDTSYLITDLADPALLVEGAGGEDRAVPGNEAAGTAEERTGRGAARALAESEAGGGATEALPDDSSYSWRVTARDGQGHETAAGGGTEYTFHVAVPESPAPFALLMPGDGDTLSGDSLAMLWRASTDPDPGDTVRYTAFLDTLPGFSTRWEVAGQLEDTAYVHHGLEDDETYYWSVRAEDGDGFTAWADTFRVEVYQPDPPQPFALTSPADGSEVPSTGDFPLTFAWEAAADPDPGDTLTYELQLAPSEDFNNVTSYDAGTADTVQVPSLAQQVWHWRVRAEDRFGLEVLSSQSWQLDVTLAAGEPGGGLPREYALAKLYPNPFNPALTAVVTLPRAAQVEVAVYDRTGRRVAELASGRRAAGYHRFRFDGSALASGVYFVRARVPGELNAVRRVVLMK